MHHGVWPLTGTVRILCVYTVYTAERVYREYTESIQRVYRWVSKPYLRISNSVRYENDSLHKKPRIAL